MTGSRQLVTTGERARIAVVLIASLMALLGMVCLPRLAIADDCIMDDSSAMDGSGLNYAAEAQDVTNDIAYGFEGDPAASLDIGSATVTGDETALSAQSITPQSTTGNVPVHGLNCQSMAYQEYNLMNQQRNANGMGSLAWSGALESTAMRRAAEIAVYYSHQRPNGGDKSCFDLYPSANAMGENIAYGYATAADVTTGWMNSSGHRANILSGSYNSVGIACFQSNGTYYWVQCFSSNGGDGSMGNSNGGATWFIDTYTDRIDVRVSSSTLTLNVGDDYRFGITDTNQSEAWSRNIKVYNRNAANGAYADLLTSSHLEWSASNHSVADIFHQDQIAWTHAYGAGTSVIKVWVPGDTGSVASVTVNVSKPTISSVSAVDLTFNGSAQYPTLTVKGSNGSTLAQGTDYTVLWPSDVTNAGTKTVTVAGIGGYSGTKSTTYTVGKADLGTCSVQAPYLFTYTGGACIPSNYYVHDSNDANLREYIDYAKHFTTESGVPVLDPVDVGKYNLVAVGMGNYQGSAQDWFQINAADISSAIVAGIADQTYSGAAITPTPAVTWNGRTLTEGTDYTLSYENNNAVGTASVTIAGMGNFSSSLVKTFRITQASLANATVSMPAVTYTGAALTPEPNSVTLGGKTLAKGVDYRILTYSNNVNAGSASIVLQGMGPYLGSSKTASFTIARATPASYSCQNPGSFTYDGTAKAPQPAVYTSYGTLTYGNGYTAVWSDNVNAGTAKMIITFTGNLQGSFTTYYRINAAPIAAATVSGIASSYTYVGSPIMPVPMVVFNGRTLNAGTDYTVSYGNNTARGTGTVSITGQGNFTGTRTSSFTIGSSISSAIIAGVDANYAFTGKFIAPLPTVSIDKTTLVRDIDYTVSYANNRSVGTATVTIAGKGAYSGSVTKSFRITAASIAAGTYALHPANNTALSADVVGYSLASGTPIQTYATAGTNNQKFTFSYDPNTASYLIRNVDSGKYLTAASFTAGADVTQEDLGGTDRQRWILVAAGDGSYYVFNRGAYGMCLDVAGFYSGSGGHIQLFTCNRTSNQRWNLEGVQTIADGTYSICTAMDYSYALDVVGFSKNDCANVQIYRNNGTANQRWTVTYLGNGYYRIVNVNSGKCLDAAGSASNGTNVQQFSWWGNANQKWKIVDVGNGQMELVNATGSAQVLDVGGAYRGNGGNAQTWTCANTSNQRWRFNR